MTQDIILFYHPTGYYGCFSNWYECKFTYLDITYTSSEQYMMHQKAILFGDYEIAKQILKETDLGKIKRLGRAVKNYDDDCWKNARRQVVKRGVKAKFIQNPDIQEILLHTKNALLAEANPRDLVWGIGLDMNDPKAANPNNWKGDNLLGEVLMEVRNEINKIIDNSTNGIIEPLLNTILFPHNYLFHKTFNELLQINETSQIVECYLYGLPKVFREEHYFNQLLNSTVAQIENQIYSPWHGAEPVQGFREMKQELNECLLYGLIEPNRNDIYYFSKYYLNKFNNNDINEEELSEDLHKINFIMDSGTSFKHKYPNAEPFLNPEETINHIKQETSIHLLTTLFYSLYRQITHWHQEPLTTPRNTLLLTSILTRLMELTK